MFLFLTYLITLKFFSLFLLSWLIINKKIYKHKIHNKKTRTLNARVKMNNNIMNKIFTLPLSLIVVAMVSNSKNIFLYSALKLRCVLNLSFINLPQNRESIASRLGVNIFVKVSKY